MDREVIARKKWIDLYETTGNAGLVCNRCGISRPTLRKWVNRYAQEGMDGLKSRKRRPHSSPQRRIFEKETHLILDLRRKRNLGARRIQSELIRNHKLRFSLATIHKVLTQHNVPPLLKLRRKKNYHRYSRPIPGERIQMDTIKGSLYQYTAIDDCSRFMVAGLYHRRTASNTIDFLRERVLEEMPAPIQRIQTDRGLEFFAYKVQECLLKWGIKFRPVKPASPHLNGKVERVQKTALFEFYSIVDFDDTNLELRLEEWQFHYNWYRPHGSLNVKTPMERVIKLYPITPLSEKVYEQFVSSKVRIKIADYKLDLKLKKLKVCP